jgi:hypothetical protein
MNKDHLLLSAQRALLFNVIDCVRFICAEISDNKLMLYIYSDRELTEDEMDLYYGVSAEMSGDFVLDDSKSKTIFIVEHGQFESITITGKLVYARYEER